jgi:hypothetical protein
MALNASRSAVGAYFGFGIVTLNTTATSTDIKVWVKTEDDADGMNPIQEMVPFDPNDRYDHSAVNIYKGRQHGDGSCTIKVGWDDAQDILRILTGHNITVMGAGPFTYDFNLVDPDLGSANHHLLGSTAREVVIERFTNSADGSSIYYQGCIPVSWSVVMEPGGMVAFTINWIHRSTTRTAKSTPLFSTNLIRTPTGQTTIMLELTKNAVATTFISNGVTVTVNQPATWRWDTADASPVNGAYVSEKRTVTLETDIEGPANDEFLIDILENPQDTLKRFDTATVRLENAGVTEQLLIALREATIEPPATRKQAGVGLARAQIALKAHHDGNEIAEVTFIGPTSDYKIT